jgi:hypothetical protein
MQKPMSNQSNSQNLGPQQKNLSRSGEIENDNTEKANYNSNTQLS